MLNSIQSGEPSSHEAKFVPETLSTLTCFSMLLFSISSLKRQLKLFTCLTLMITATTFDLSLRRGVVGVSEIQSFYRSGAIVRGSEEAKKRFRVLCVSQISLVFVCSCVVGVLVASF